MREDPDGAIWAFTPVEVIAALWRRVRGRLLSHEDRVEAEVALAELERSWKIVSDMPGTIRLARRLLSMHPLRGADALQLAAALSFLEEAPEPALFVTLDLRLAEAARREGFEVITR